MLGPAITVYPIGRMGLDFVGQSMVVNAPPGLVTTAPDVYPDPGTPVSGLVTDELGAAVAGAEVFTTAMNCFFSSSACHSFTSADGSYAMRRPPLSLAPHPTVRLGSLYIVAPRHHLNLSDGVPEVANFVLQRGARIEADASSIGGSMPMMSAALVCTAPGVPTWASDTVCLQPDGSTTPTAGRYEGT